MMRQTELMEISEVRAMVRQVAHGQPVPDKVIQLARDTVQAMCQEAAGYGLTEAEVVKAVFSPVFQRRLRCDCPTCKEQRSQTEKVQLRRWQTESLRKVV